MMLSYDERKIYYSINNYDCVRGNIKEKQDIFEEMYLDNLIELNNIIGLIENNKDYQDCLYVLDLLTTQRNLICFEFPFSYKAEEYLDFLKKDNLARIYTIEGNFIFEIVPKINFFKHPMDNYSIYLTDLKMRGIYG